MKQTLIRYLLLGWIATGSVSCGSTGILVDVRNPSSEARRYETVEIVWSDVAFRLSGVSPDRIVVLDKTKRQIPSQVVYEGSSEPRLLIFQVSLPPAGSDRYTIRKAAREEYPAQAYGRYVPERSDDYAWENNLTAWRVYGPALSDPRTQGIDAWVKSTGRLVIDDWYAGKDYHTDHGEGMDAYKVGPTLGAGGSAPCIDGKLGLIGNYASQETLDNGPIRTTVKLTYAPFEAAGKKIEMECVVSLDAHSRFNRITTVYTGDFETLPIAAGIALHEVKERSESTGSIAVTEALSDTRQPEVDGNISLGILMPESEGPQEIDGHLVLLHSAARSKPFVYWCGSGWSRAGIADHDEWLDEMRRKREQILAPLSVFIIKRKNGL
jgi:hypothetical protein